MHVCVHADIILGNNYEKGTLLYFVYMYRGKIKWRIIMTKIIYYVLRFHLCRCILIKSVVASGPDIKVEIFKIVPYILTEINIMCDTALALWLV